MELVGKSVAKYRIVAALGDGGMGAVYLAEHQEIGRRAAIKVLHRRFSDEPETVERFLNEARATDRIQHDGIVDIYDAGRDPEVGAYLVMEYLEGETLAGRLKREPRLPVDEACEIVCAVGEILEAAHGAGIVHRDLKPANIFLLAGSPTIKLLDFGIAKLFGDSASMVRTRTGELFGTPLYMSPEQCHGAKSVDHRADIYALGVISYQLLCGRVPFDAEGFGELIGMHLAQAPPSLRDQRPEIVPELERVVLRALAKDPQARQQSMAELKRDLQTAQQQQQRAPSAPAAAATGATVRLAQRPAAADVAAAPLTDGRDDEPSRPAASDTVRSAFRPSGRRWLVLLVLLVAVGGAAAAIYLRFFAEDPQRRCVAGDLADCRRQCDLDQLDSCLELARMFRGGRGVARSATRAATLLKTLCDRQHSEGCRLLGKLYASGEGVRRDVAQAAILLRQACEQRAFGACAEAGQMYRDGKGVAADLPRAARLLRRGCDGGADRACLLLGELHAREGPHRDGARAEALLKRSCERKLVRGCIVLADLLAAKKGEADLRAAAGLYGQGCKLGDTAACAAHKRLEAQRALRAAAMAKEAAGPRRVGWVYLGNHDGHWRSRYFEIPAATEPKRLVGEALRALRASNIRFAPPDPSGALGRVTGGIKPGTRVRVLEVRAWEGSGYTWARVQALPSP